MSRRARRGTWAGLAAVAMLVSATIAASMVKVHYWSYSPGALRDTSTIVMVDGVEAYPAEGTISFATVSIHGRLTLLRFAIAWIDPDATIVAEERVTGGRIDPDENRRLNLQMMDMSTQVSSYVALERLGYSVEVEGTGAMIVEIEAGYPADGILEPGDTIVAVDGVAVSRAEHLVAAISEQPPGTEVTLTVEPLGSTDTEDRRVVLDAREDDETKAFLGVWPQTRDANFVFPFDIQFVTGGVAGPSAGLAFTLALLDMLTPGELTGGLSVAATGTIDFDGNIGQIGGLEQKAIGARREGYDVFFVPASTPAEELDIARRAAGSRTRIIPVETLDEVLEHLVDLGGDPLPAR